MTVHHPELKWIDARSQIPGKDQATKGFPTQNTISR